MKKIIAIGGSNSRKSINRTLATYVANLLTDVEVIVADLNDFEMPVYSPDLEQENGIPDNTKKLDDLIASADGVVLSLAEYNGSYTPAYKNVFDWMSRINQKVWKDKPIFLMATSPGAKGGASVLSSAKNSMGYFAGNVIADFSLPSFYDNYTEDGIKDGELKNALNDKVQLFQAAI
ncbi:MAG: NADPH-dependent FMN reductase [Chitinophagales bacterium]